MVDIKREIAEELQQKVEVITLEDALELLEVPQEETMGDYALPCFRLAKVMKMPPAKIAKDIADKLTGSTLIEKIDSVNAYVNMFVNKEKMAKVTLSEAGKPGLTKSDEGDGKKVIVEYSSPNIAKPFHIGHIRSTVIGNAIANIYERLGYDVVRLNHLGDYGTQFGKMIVAYRKWGDEEKVNNDPIPTLVDLYQKFHDEAKDDPSLDDEAREAFVKLEKGSEDEVRLWKWFSDVSLKEFKRVYDMLGIRFDDYDGESFYSDKMPSVVKELEDKSLLKESRGAKIVDLTDVGLDTPIIIKSDGSTIYMTRDLATAIYRKNHYDFYKNIYVVATQQNLYFKQLKAVLAKMGYEWEKDCIHVPFGMVSLENGQILSTRGGNVVYLEDVLNNAVDKTKQIILEKNPDFDKAMIDEIASTVGIGAVVFNELSNNRIKDYVFSWDQVLNFDGETGPYVQYTHARCASVLRKAGNDIVTKAGNVQQLDLKGLAGSKSYSLIKLIYALPGVVRDAAEKYEPSLITRHITEIAKGYNRFYHDEYILTDDQDECTAKVALTIAAKNAIKEGLELLGMKAPDRM